MATGWLGAVLTLGSIVLWTAFSRPAAWDPWLDQMTLGLVGLGGILVAFDAYIRRDSLRKRRHAPLPVSSLLGPAVLRWAGWLILLGLAAVIYQSVAYYDDRWYARFHRVYRVVILLWGVGGIPYYLLVLRRRHGSRWDRRDPAILTMALLRRLGHMIQARHFDLSALRPFFRAGRVRSVWLGLVVKGFFLPIMLIFFYGNAREVAEILVRIGDGALGRGLYPDGELLYLLSYRSLMFVDVTLAVLGYAITSRIIENGIRSVEPTTGGWLVALLCYRPFNDVLAWYFRWPTESLPSLPDTPFKLALMALVIGLIAVYVWATLAFGLRFSNLTHRGIVTGGPYAFVRHPAYISKNLAWWVEHLPSFTAPRAAFFMLGWNAIYGLRAWTEERHLKADPQYRRYMALVPRRFVPWRRRPEAGASPAGSV